MIMSLSNGHAVTAPNESKLSKPSLDESNVISYRWPQIYVPHTSLTRYIVEKFLFYSSQIFLTDSVSTNQFTYKHILLDSLKTAQILRCNRVTSESVVAIVGGNNYEHVCTIFAVLLLEAKIVLLPSNARKDQIAAAVNRCSVTNLAVVKPKVQSQNVKESIRVEALNGEYKKSYSMSFGESKSENPDECLPDSKSYTVFSESALNSKILGLQRPPNENNWERTRLVVPVFKGSKIRKVYSINEFALMSQLTYATLPQSGFEWNINDNVLNMAPFCTVLGVLELLATFSVGARMVLTRQDRLLSSEQFAELVKEHKCTAVIVHSSYLVDLIKSTGVDSLSPLEKVLYVGQPIHRNIVSVFKKKYTIHNCRYGFYLLESSGFAAIEVLNYSVNNASISVTPLPSMEMFVLNRETGLPCRSGQLGKIFIRSPYSSRSSLRRRSDGWVFSGCVGFYNNQCQIQVIDLYCNFIKSGHTFISKTLVETVLLSHQAVARAVAMKNPSPGVQQQSKQEQSTKSSSKSKQFQAFVTLKEGQECGTSEEAISNYLNSYLNDNLMQWTVTVVDRLARTPLPARHHRIVTRRVAKSKKSAQEEERTS